MMQSYTPSPPMSISVCVRPPWPVVDKFAEEAEAGRFVSEAYHAALDGQSHAFLPSYATISLFSRSAVAAANAVKLVVIQV